jgi:transcriptional regulator with XRE-family HTH domain
MTLDDQPKFGDLLRRHRLGAGLTQEELAERAGLSARAITDLERGVRRFPYFDTVARLADALGLNAGGAQRLHTRRHVLEDVPRRGGVALEVDVAPKKECRNND